jgi:hypothetical protein
MWSWNCQPGSALVERSASPTRPRLDKTVNDENDLILLIEGGVGPASPFIPDMDVQANLLAGAYQTGRESLPILSPSYTRQTGFFFGARLGNYSIGFGFNLDCIFEAGGAISHAD